MQKIKPVGKHVLLKPSEPVKKVGLIYVPESFYKRPAEGWVVSRGEAVDVDVRVGSVVMHEPNAGILIEDKFLAIHEDNLIYAV